MVKSTVRFMILVGIFMTVGVSNLNFERFRELRHIMLVVLVPSPERSKEQSQSDVFIFLTRV